MIIRFLFIVLLLSNFLYTPAQAPIQDEFSLKQKYKQAQALLEVSPDTAVVCFKEIVDRAFGQNDTLAMMSCMRICKAQGLAQDFADAFSYGLQALRIAYSLNDSVFIARNAKEIGALYREFGKEEVSESYAKQALSITKVLYKHGEVAWSSLAGAYLNIANHYRTFEHYNTAKQYIDTCETISQNNGLDEIFACYHRAERASIHIALGEASDAILILKRIAFLIESRLDDDQLYRGIKGYLSIIYLYMGDAYHQLGQLTKAITSYNKSLAINEVYGYHNSNRSKTYESLANLNFKLNNCKEAYLCLQKSKALADNDWGARSEKNASFIEISDQFQKEIEQQRLTLLEQDKLVAQQKQRILGFRILLISLVSLAFLAFLLLRIRHQKLVFRKEKEELDNKRVEANLAVDHKNKELTVHTLQLIEKERIINSLAEDLKEKAKGDRVTLSKIKAIDANSKALWDDFNNRFLAVNNDFYKRLKTRFPELSPTERKHCALIRLKFKGKEMAHLLGITEHSVHVSRYRLRKKMKLDSTQNLTDFIGEL